MVSKRIEALVGVVWLVCRAGVGRRSPHGIALHWSMAQGPWPMEGATVPALGQRKIDISYQQKRRGKRLEYLTACAWGWGGSCWFAQMQCLYGICHIVSGHAGAAKLGDACISICNRKTMDPFAMEAPLSKLHGG